MKNIIKYLSPTASLIILGIIFFLLANIINWLNLFLIIAFVGIVITILGARNKFVSLGIAGVLIFFLSSTAWSISEYQTNTNQPINLAKFSIDLTSINTTKNENIVYLPGDFLGYEYNYSATALISNTEDLENTTTYYAVCDLGKYPATQVNWLNFTVQRAIDRRMTDCLIIWNSPNISGTIIKNMPDSDIATFLEITNGDANQEFFQNFTMFFNYLYYSVILVILATLIELLVNLIRRPHLTNK